MTNCQFGDYSLYDLIGEHSEWIHINFPTKEEQDPGVCCVFGENCTTEFKNEFEFKNSEFKNEWIMSLAGSKWFAHF